MERGDPQRRHVEEAVNEHTAGNDASLTPESFCHACGRLLSEPPIAECVRPDWHNVIPPAPCRVCGGTGRDPLDPDDPCPGCPIPPGEG